jgi:hypothetical protein
MYWHRPPLALDPELRPVGDIPLLSTGGEDSCSLCEGNLLDWITGIDPDSGRQLVVRIAVVSNLQIGRLIAKSLDELVDLWSAVPTANRPKSRLMRWSAAVPLR